MIFGRSTLLVGAAALATSVLLARAHPFGDAGLYARPPMKPLLQDASVPIAVRETLVSKCADCHSMQPHSPFYGRLAPFSWLMERDIKKARAAMNLSEWNAYSEEEREAYKVKILLETKSHQMPLLQYRAIHWNARVTENDISRFEGWARNSISSAVPQVAPLTAEGDAARGKDVFESRCTGCHSLDQNREGPRLRGVFGRVSGSVPNFGYSPALKAAHIKWNDASLEHWLADPDVLIPGNDMGFHVANPQERKDLIRFLEVNVAH